MGHKSIIQMLLDAGANANLIGGPYGNSFQAAAENGDSDIVELLLEHEADINAMIRGEIYSTSRNGKTRLKRYGGTVD